MAESKQYITQALENGSVQISEDVIAAIVSHAACEVEGVASVNVKPGTDIVELIGKKKNKGLKVTVQEDNAVVLDCNLTVNYGKNIMEIAKAAQVAITNALESMSCIQIAAVNVNICSIVRQ